MPLLKIYKDTVFIRGLQNDVKGSRTSCLPPIKWLSYGPGLQAELTVIKIKITRPRKNNPVKGLKKSKIFGEHWIRFDQFWLAIYIVHELQHWLLLLNF